MKTTILLPFLLLGCDTAEPVAETSDLGAQALTVGTELEVCDGDCDPGPTDTFKSLVVTDPVILARFPLRRVMDQLITLSGSTNTADNMWSQWWSSQRLRTGGDPLTSPFCDDNGSTINGFAIQCPRAESILERVPLESHAPVALFNRFDLAPMDGANCGEYRIVYAMRGDDRSTDVANAFNVPGRNFIIFEGVLPNPHPECELAGCVEVAQFWQALSSEPDVNVRAQHLDDFYFTGTCDYEPVVKPEHYGLNCRGGGGYNGGCGQIRTNQFIDRPWNLRQFTLEQDFLMSGIDLEVNQTTVAANPHESLFKSTSPLFPAFQPDFMANVNTLLPIPDGPNQISINTSPRFDAGESLASGGGIPFMPPNDYITDPPFQATINAAVLPAHPLINGTDDVAERATTQSCGGCHEVSNFDFVGQSDVVGPNVQWPPSLGFVHVDENSLLSPALLGTFLPHRQNILDNFLAATCGTDCLEGGKLIKVVSEGEPGREPEAFTPPTVDFDIVTVEEWERLELPDFDTLGGSRTH